MCVCVFVCVCVCVCEYVCVCAGMGEGGGEWWRGLLMCVTNASSSIFSCCY